MGPQGSWRGQVLQLPRLWSLVCFLHVLSHLIDSIPSTGLVSAPTPVNPMVVVVMVDVPMTTEDHVVVATRIAVIATETTTTMVMSDRTMVPLAAVVTIEEAVVPTVITLPAAAVLKGVALLHPSFSCLLWSVVVPWTRVVLINRLVPQ